MKWIAGLLVAMILGVAVALFLMGDIAWAVSQSEQDMRMADNGTATAYTEITCTGSTVTVLTAAQTVNAIRMQVRNLDATNAVTLCPGVSCAAATSGITLVASTATMYVPPIVFESVRSQNFTCFSTAGTPIIEVWLEKTE